MEVEAYGCKNCDHTGPGYEPVRYECDVAQLHERDMQPSKFKSEASTSSDNETTSLVEMKDAHELSNDDLQDESTPSIEHPNVDGVEAVMLNPSLRSIINKHNRPDFSRYSCERAIWNWAADKDNINFIRNFGNLWVRVGHNNQNWAGNSVVDLRISRTTENFL